MARRTKRNINQPSFLEVSIHTAACVPKIREAVAAWAAGGYRGVTPTTKTLLNHWFHTDHRPFGRKFQYFYFQREAIETLIYLYEVAKNTVTRTCWKPTPPSPICACCNTTGSRATA